ncbi:hypothetical protein [Streptococcus uberis]|uniref:hypothetical protein n=1 Tax=Streptococcus uberis TaxID=1349 RepID=UPI001EF0CB7F|nr:hypothetical protein [Streptococcus uberis]MCK1165201.1 hypothetical protein [Streptococcus uberis]MCK1196576.1 hypothetical protein [Streptococcus uberis]MCK1251376.1 hypothetical protein [Streptococcus uberis]
MIQELNLTIGQLLVLLPLLILLLLITLSKHSYIEIDLPDIEQRTNKGINPNYGAYIQSQSKYYN